MSAELWLPVLGKDWAAERAGVGRVVVVVSMSHLLAAMCNPENVAKAQRCFGLKYTLEKPYVLMVYLLKKEAWLEFRLKMGICLSFEGFRKYCPISFRSENIFSCLQGRAEQT